jgi:hypothetical protein
MDGAPELWWLGFRITEARGKVSGFVAEVRGYNEFVAVAIAQIAPRSL